MSGAYRQDYLLRQVKAAAEMLARIVNLRSSGNTEEARAQLQAAYDSLLGSRGDLIRGLDSAAAATLLTSPEAILALARLTNEEAEQHWDRDQSRELRLRAMELGIEAAQRDNKSAAIRTFLAGLLPMVDRQELTRERREFLAREFGSEPGPAGGVDTVPDRRPMEDGHEESEDR
jgi:hypothetical protein